MQLLYRRPDGTFVASINGVPYHVIPSDDLWDDAAGEAERLGNALPYEPAPPVLPPQPRIIYKADIWRRATDAEAETIAAALDGQSVRLRRMWTDAQYLSSDDDIFPTIEAALVATFGATRAAELLA